MSRLQQGYFHILISSSTRKPRGGSRNTHDQITLTELLKIQKNGQFPADLFIMNPAVGAKVCLFATGIKKGEIRGVKMSR
jgi:hypothetical protein